MRKTPAIGAVLAIFVAGCASHEGVYSPRCIAYEGSSIELTGGNFTWEKFTDQVRVDDSGKVVDPFPGFPRRGTYRVDGSTVRLQPDAGEPLPSMHLVRQEQNFFLLNEQQYQQFNSSGDPSDCALVLGGSKR